MVVPLFVGRQRSIKALEEATQKQSPIFFPRKKTPRPTSRPKMIFIKSARLGSVVQMLKLPDGTVKVLDRGQEKSPGRALCEPIRIFSWSKWKMPRKSSSEIRKSRLWFAKFTPRLRITSSSRKKIPPEMVMSRIVDRRSRQVGGHDRRTSWHKARGPSESSGDV